jgi:hypothetical protein
MDKLFKYIISAQQDIKYKEEEKNKQPKKDPILERGGKE